MDANHPYEVEPAAPKHARSRKFLAWAIAVVLLGGALLAVQPYKRKARDQARRITCVGNIKSLSLCLLMYASDYDDRLPPLASGRRDEWVTEARQFISSAGMPWCPDDERYREYRASRARDVGAPRLSYEDELRAPRSQVGRMSSYLMNPKLAGVKLGDLRDPAHDILLEEAGEFHKGYRIVAYADGHAKILRRRGR